MAFCHDLPHVVDFRVLVECRGRESFTLHPGDCSPVLPRRPRCIRFTRLLRRNVRIRNAAVFDDDLFDVFVERFFVVFLWKALFEQAH